MNCSRKIKPLKALALIIKKHKKNNKTIVFTNGCFDILHPGHIMLLEKAKACGDILIVGLNSDASIKKIKGRKRPIMPQQARAQLVAALESVNYVIFFNEPTPYATIKTLEPHVLVKGGDWNNTAIIGRTLVKKTVRVRIVKNYSTTAIIRTICRKYKDAA